MQSLPFPSSLRTASALSRRWHSIIRLVCFALAATFVLPAVQADEETELGKVMEKMSSAYRKLRRQVKDSSKNESSLALVADLRTAANESLKHIPALAAEQPADQREAFVAGYKKKMHEFLAAIDPVEAALKAGNNDEADALVGKLNALQKEGHKQYKKPSKS